jgi:Beta-propeller repeat
MIKSRFMPVCRACAGALLGLCWVSPVGRWSARATQEFAPAGATFLGGSGTDDSYEVSLAVSASSSVYVTGFTTSRDFPVTADAYDPHFNGGDTDRFVSRFEQGLSRMSGSTYIGSPGQSVRPVRGTGDDVGHAIAIDAEGNVFIAGYTNSADFPVTENAFDTAHHGGREVFVSKLDSDLSTLLASTFVGGTGDEGYQWPRIDMTVIPNGDVVVVGITRSIDFPTTEGAFARSFNGGAEGGDAFIAILDNDLSTLKAGTYVGGSGNEWRPSVDVGDDGRVCVAGETESSDFPVSRTAYDGAMTDHSDAFIACLDAQLATLEASTHFGGSRMEEALDVEITPSGGVFIAGYTESVDLPVTAGAYRATWGGGARDGYVAAFTPDLSTLVSATLLGGVGVDMSRGLTIGPEGLVYVTGNTTSSDFPTMDDSFSTGLRGGLHRGDIFVLGLDPDLRSLRFSILIGGSGEDTGSDIDVDPAGMILVVGSTTSADLPMLPNSFDASFNGGTTDGFVLELDPIGR